MCGAEELVEAELPPETFSDLDDDEIDTFLLSNEERDLKAKVPHSKLQVPPKGST